MARRTSVEPDVVEGIWQQFADLGELAGNAIDVTSMTPDAVAAELAAGLGGRFLLSP